MSAAPPLSPMATLRWSVVRRILDELRPSRVLEIGCGQGGFAARLATRYQYVGVEPDEQSYKVARDRIEPIGGQVLHPGGAILVSVPAWPVRYGPMDKLVGHYRRYTPEQLDEVLLKTGATDVRHFLYGWPLGYVLEAVRNGIAQRRGTASEDSMHARSATSGRLLQPKRAAGAVVRAGVAPFTVLQRLRRTTGTGAVGVARFAPGEAPHPS